MGSPDEGLPFFICGALSVWDKVVTNEQANGYANDRSSVKWEGA